MYIGPDTLMPLASVFAAIAGFFLMFWRRIVGAVKLDRVQVLVQAVRQRGASLRPRHS